MLNGAAACAGGRAGGKQTERGTGRWSNGGTRRPRTNSANVWQEAEVESREGAQKGRLSTPATTPSLQVFLLNLLMMFSRVNQGRAAPHPSFPSSRRHRLRSLLYRPAYIFSTSLLDEAIFIIFSVSVFSFSFFSVNFTARDIKLRIKPMPVHLKKDGTTEARCRKSWKVKLFCLSTWHVNNLPKGKGYQRKITEYDHILRNFDLF